MVLDYNLLEKNENNIEFSDFLKNFDINNGIEPNEKKILLDIMIKIKKNNEILDNYFIENKNLTANDKLKIKEKLKNNTEFLKKLVGIKNIEKVIPKNAFFIPPNSIDTLMKNIFNEKDLDKLVSVKNMSKESYFNSLKNREDELNFYLNKLEELSSLIYDLAVEKHYIKYKTNDLTGILKTLQETTLEIINTDEILKTINKERGGDFVKELIKNPDMHKLMSKLHTIYNKNNKQEDYEMTNKLQYTT